MKRTSVKLLHGHEFQFRRQNSARECSLFPLALTTLLSIFNLPLNLLPLYFKVRKTDKLIQVTEDTLHRTWRSNWVFLDTSG